jgi:hypothetical protein
MNEEGFPVLRESLLRFYAKYLQLLWLPAYFPDYRLSGNGDESLNYPC